MQGGDDPAHRLGGVLLDVAHVRPHDVEPEVLDHAVSSAMPLEFAAIWARRSARLVAGSLDGYSADASSLTVSASRSLAPETSSQLSISTPSSSSRVLLAHGARCHPPISAWCPRLAT